MLISLEQVGIPRFPWWNSLLTNGPKRSSGFQVHFDAMDEKLLEEWLSALNPILQEEIQVESIHGLRDRESLSDLSVGW